MIWKARLSNKFEAEIWFQIFKYFKVLITFWSIFYKIGLSNKITEVLSFIIWIWNILNILYKYDINVFIWQHCFLFANEPRFLLNKNIEPWKIKSKLRQLFDVLQFCRRFCRRSSLKVSFFNYFIEQVNKIAFLLKTG